MDNHAVKSRLFILAVILYLLAGLPIAAYGLDGDTVKIVYDPDLTVEEADALVDRLFIQASSGEIKYSKMVQPSKDSIAALGEKALHRMCAKLNARDARERWTISDIFRALGTTATDSLVSYLNSDQQYVLLNVGRCLEQIQDTSSTLACLPLLRHEKYPVRSQFASTLGKNKDRRAVEDLMAVLDDDPVDDVRKSAAVALGRIADPRAADILIAHLIDPYFGVRKTASQALVQLDPVPLEDIAHAANTLPGLGAGMAIETLGKTKDEHAAKYLLKFLESPDWRTRGYTIDALAELETDTAKRTLRALEESTVSRSLFERARLRAALASLSEKE